MTHSPLPTPDQMLDMLNDSADGRTAIVVTAHEAQQILILLATMNDLTPTCDDPECGICNAFNTLFWSISNALPISARINYQRELRGLGVELPKAPWETVAER